VRRSTGECLFAKGELFGQAHPNTKAGPRSKHSAVGKISVVAQCVFAAQARHSHSPQASAWRSGVERVFEPFQRFPMCLARCTQKLIPETVETVLQVTYTADPRLKPGVNETNSFGHQL